MSVYGVCEAWEANPTPLLHTSYASCQILEVLQFLMQMWFLYAVKQLYKYVGGFAPSEKDLSKMVVPFVLCMQMKPQNPFSLCRCV